MSSFHPHPVARVPPREKDPLASAILAIIFTTSPPHIFSQTYPGARIRDGWLVTFNGPWFLPLAGPGSFRYRSKRPIDADGARIIRNIPLPASHGEYQSRSERAGFAPPPTLDDHSGCRYVSPLTFDAPSRSRGD